MAGSFWIGDSEIAAYVASVGMDKFALTDSRAAHVAVFDVPPANVSHTYVELRDSVIDGALAPDGASGAFFSTFDPVVILRTDVLDTRDGLRIVGLAPDVTGELEIDRLRYRNNAQPLLIVNKKGTLVRSDFLDNTTSDVGNPMPGALRVGLARSDLRVSGSTFAGNRGSASAGGAVLASGSDISLIIENSTFTNNSIAAAAVGMPGGARGGSIGWSSVSGSTLVLRHVTIVADGMHPLGLTAPRSAASAPMPTTSLASTTVSCAAPATSERVRWIPASATSRTGAIPVVCRPASTWSESVPAHSHSAPWGITAG
ncbi:hypothetical protein [Pseudofulvimonas gallinarii]|uniref:hypothetical protein n=1 Tax=Pseudofulvimonas gallinarii TaxID=634155 RepID=UPI0035E65EE1